MKKELIAVLLLGLLILASFQAVHNGKMLELQQETNDLLWEQNEALLYDESDEDVEEWREWCAEEFGDEPYPAI